tara:strand:- start:484 stop:1791 length:1308 start_codon:yes stop_codon:yes gene_type:complete
MSKIKKINLCIAGLGTVGSNVVKILSENHKIFLEKDNIDFNIVGVSAKNKFKKRIINIDKFKWFSDPIKMIHESNYDILIELIGEEKGISFELIKQTLENNKNVVTANKALLAKNGSQLFKIAEKNNVQLLFEAAVAGGIPIVKVIKQSLHLNNIIKISGILNGTTNYILSEMENKNSNFSETLKDAQIKGFAESNPTNDIEGVDSAHKLSLLTTISFGATINFNKISYKGISDIHIDDIKNAKKLGYKIKLISESQLMNNQVSTVVEPRLIKFENYLSSVNGVLNAIKIKSNFLNPLILEGEGAGGKPTASSIISDLYEISLYPYSNSLGFSTDKLFDYQYMDASNSLCSYYLRIIVKDISGVLAKITSNLNEVGISIETILQIPENKFNEGIPIIIVTHETKKNLLKKALDKIEKLEFVLSNITTIAIDKSIE